MKNSRPHRFAKRVALGSLTSAMPNDGQNRSLRSLFWPSCAGFHPELSAAARSARDIGHLRVCAAHSSSLNPFVKKMQAFSNLRDFANPAHVSRHVEPRGRPVVGTANLKAYLKQEI